MAETAELENSAPGARVPEDSADCRSGAWSLHIAGLHFTALPTEALGNLEDGKKQLERKATWPRINAVCRVTAACLGALSGASTKALLGSR